MSPADERKNQRGTPKPEPDLRLPGSVAEILASPPGPKIGAFFDLDGTLVAGFTAVILTQERLRRRDKAPAPSDVKRAIDYMQDNLRAPVSLVDIVAEAGVPGRTLFKHFRDFRGTSPMQYLRNARLEKAREALLGARHGDTVTSVAMSLAFGHLGRFSLEYQRRFGEKPSETIRRAPRR